MAHPQIESGYHVHTWETPGEGAWRAHLVSGGCKQRTHPTALIPQSPIPNPQSPGVRAIRPRMAHPQMESRYPVHTWETPGEGAWRAHLVGGACKQRTHPTVLNPQSTIRNPQSTMPFTSPDLVRAHIANANFGEAEVREVPAILNGTTPAQLPHAGLTAGAIVKSKRANTPASESATLTTGWIVLNHAQLIADTVVIANNSSLGLVYTENIDFVVDYAGGRVRRIESGAISNGQTVSIWYGHFHIYTEGDDYAINALSGQLTRKSTGDIADGQQVLVDYTVSLGSVSDTIIDQAIAESGEAVLTIISEANHESPSPGIVIGATHMAVAQLARMRAATLLADSTINASVARAAAQLWLEIASQYDRSAHTFLARFANPISPRHGLRRG